jgi:anti-anti-sigma regulatory factor
MLTVHVENIGDLAIVQCQGRLVRSDAAFKLRNAVRSQANARVIALDLSEVHAIEGGGLGMLCVLNNWAHEQGIELKLFNPTYSVKNRLEHNNVVEFEIATLEDMMTMLAEAETPYAHAA